MIAKNLALFQDVSLQYNICVVQKYVHCLLSKGGPHMQGPRIPVERGWKARSDLLKGVKVHKHPLWRSS
jgi:hypothetical protein